MPHHEYETSPEVQQAIRDAFLEAEAERLGLGPTGRFPQGKLSSHDEGELCFAVAVYEGKVVVNFGTPITSLGLDIEDARNLADLLRYKAAEAERGKVRPS